MSLTNMMQLEQPLAKAKGNGVHGTRDTVEAWISCSKIEKGDFRVLESLCDQHSDNALMLVVHDSDLEGMWVIFPLVYLGPSSIAGFEPFEPLIRSLSDMGFSHAFVNAYICRLTMSRPTIVYVRPMD
jgi:hypothetical protein